MNPIFTLEEIGCKDVHQVGEEAAALGELMKIGASVSPAFVIPTSSYREFLNQKEVRTVLDEYGSSEKLRDQLSTVSLPKILERSLRSSYRVLSGQRDTFVSLRANGMAEMRALGEEELIHAVKRILIDHLSQQLFLRKDPSRSTLSILVQQIEQQNLGGKFLTSDPCNEEMAVVEVLHPDGKERFFLRKETHELSKRLVTGIVNEPVAQEFIISFTPWAKHIEKHLGGPRQLGWQLYQGVFNFVWVKPLFPRKRVPLALKLLVNVDSPEEEVFSIGASGVVTTTAEHAIVLARQHPVNPVFLRLWEINEGELVTFRRAKHKEGLGNLHLILPQARTVDGLRELKRTIAGEGLLRGPRMKLYFPIAFPSNVVLLERFAEIGLDGMVFEGKQLARRFLGVHEPAGMDESVLWALESVCRICRQSSLDLLYSGDIKEELIDDLLAKGVTQVIADVTDGEAILLALTNAEKRVLSVHA